MLTEKQQSSGESTANLVIGYPSESNGCDTWEATELSAKALEDLDPHALNM